MALSEDDADAPAKPEGPEARAATALGNVRGSSVLLSGRLFALLIGGATQVVIVRYLSKSDYGAFAYGLAVAAFVEIAATIVHRQSLTRFLFLYEQRRDYDKLFGTIVMVLGLIVATTCLLFAGAIAFRSVLTRDVGELVTRILIIMLAIGGLEAVDDVLEAMFAVFALPRTIFFRKYLLAPGVQLAIAITMVVGKFSVLFLATAAVIGWAIAVSIYFATFIFTLRDRGLLQHFRLRTLSMPFAEVFGFGVPLITTQLVFLCTSTISIILLEQMGGTTEVANLRAILPLSDMNQLVIFTFTMLFMPLAARMFMNGDTPGMKTAYWHSAIWLAVLSFPMFAMTGPLAYPVTVFLFGQKYRSSAALLSVLSVGLFFNAALGFNALTLQTYGRLRFVAFVNLACVVVDIALMIVLIPHLGALAVAIATCSTMVVQNLCNQVGMRHEIGIPMFEPACRGVYGSIVVAAGALWAAELFLKPALPEALVLAAVASAAIVIVNRRILRVVETFPEVARIPLFGTLLK